MFNRVEASRCLIQVTIEDDDIPLYHIDGEHNPVDLIT